MDTTNSSRLFSLNTTKIPLTIIRKIPINEFVSGTSEKIIIPIIIAKIKWTYSVILLTKGDPTLYAAIKQNIPRLPVVEIKSINPIN